MDLVVTTPGVETTRLQTHFDSEREAQFRTIARATRCGSLAVDPTLADRVRIAVAPCAVSLHAADRLCTRLAECHHSVDGIIVCETRQESTLTDDRISAVFDDTVSVTRVDDGTGCGQIRYYNR